MFQAVLMFANLQEVHCQDSISWLLEELRWNKRMLAVLGSNCTALFSEHCTELPSLPVSFPCPWPCVANCSHYKQNTSRSTSLQPAHNTGTLLTWLPPCSVSMYLGIGNLEWRISCASSTGACRRCRKFSYSGMSWYPDFRHCAIV